MGKQKTEQKAIEKAFKLLEEYKRPETSEERIDKIVAQLFRMGYIIRPLQTFIMQDEAHCEVLNQGSNEWGLVNRFTRRPLTRD